MKYRTMMITMAIGSASFFTHHSFAQSREEMSQADRDNKDSVETVALQDARTQTVKDESRMAEAKNDRKQSKARAKHAQRVEKEANNAARQSRYALRAERRAQKARKQADKQAEKASDARDKSNRN